jgi:hypothetical protein
VAIKVLFAIELTPLIVAKFYSEIQAMYHLQHENVIKCLGISVMPPTICVILEFCPHGSLYDYLYSASDSVAMSLRSSDASVALSVENLKKLESTLEMKKPQLKRVSSESLSSDNINLTSNLDFRGTRSSKEFNVELKEGLVSGRSYNTNTSHHVATALNEPLSERESKKFDIEKGKNIV